MTDGQTADDQIEAHWTFRLTPSGTTTDVEHRLWALPPKQGAEEWIAFMERIDRVKTIREGMRRTLANVKAAADSR